MSVPPTSEAAVIREAIGTLIERAPEMSGEAWASAALQPVMAMSNYVAALEARLAEAERRFAAIEAEGDAMGGHESRERLALRVGHMGGMAQRGKDEIAAALPPESETDWTEYHEYRKRTDPPPYGQGKDDGPPESAEG